MKRVIIALIWMLGAVSMVNAQDNVQGELEIFGSTAEVSHIFTQTAMSGSFEALDSGRYNLTLVGIPERTTIFEVSPPGAITYNTAELATDWTTALNTTSDMDDMLFAAEAELDIDGNYVLMVLYGMSYDIDAEALTYEVEVLQYVPAITDSNFDLTALTADAEKAQLPQTFDAATITISATESVWDSLQNGAEVRLDAIRAQPAGCDDAYKTLEELRDQEQTPDVRRQIAVTRGYIRVNCR